MKDSLYAMLQIAIFSTLVSGLILASASSSYSEDIGANSKDRLVINDTDIILQIPGKSSISFHKDESLGWSVGSICVWDKGTKVMTPGFSFDDGDFLRLGNRSGNISVKADRYEPIRKGSVTGVRFFGSVAVPGGAHLDWESAFTVNSNDPLPLIHNEVYYSSKQSIKLEQNPQIVIRTSAAGEESAMMSNIMGYLKSDPGGQIALEQGYPAVWVQSIISGDAYNCLSIVDTDDRDMNGNPVKKSFSIGRKATDGKDYTFWSIRNQDAAGNIESDRKYHIDADLYFSKGGDWLEFYRNTWSGLIDYVCPPEKVPFFAKNWDECAKGLIEDFKDKDNELYIPGKGYIIGAGGKHTHWMMAPPSIHGILYNTWASNDQPNFDFYKKRMEDCNLNQWWLGDKPDDGINWGWDTKNGFASAGNMWQMLDMGAYNVYYIYKLTKDDYYLKFLKRFLDYTKKKLIANNTIGQNWDPKSNVWYYTNYNGYAPETRLSQSETDHRDYPGALAVYAYLCLVTYQETGEKDYRDSAYSYIDHVNSFLTKPGLLWTIEPYTKTNGFSFAMMANIKRYELTKDSKYLDYAEQWAYYLLTMYHLKDEQGGELALAHAGGQGLGEFYCVATLETVEPAYQIANLLKYRINPAFLKFMSLMDRTHLTVFPKNRPNYENQGHVGGVKDIQWSKYLYIPLELLQYGSDPAMYMGGAPMIENMVLHGLNRSSDTDITVICTDAAETGMNIKHERNLVVYNPMSTDKEFTLFLAGFDAGNYTVKIDGKHAGTYSSAQLEKGVPCSLGAMKWNRIAIVKS